MAEEGKTRGVRAERQLIKSPELVLNRDAISVEIIGNSKAKEVARNTKLEPLKSSHSTLRGKNVKFNSFEEVFEAVAIKKFLIAAKFS